MERYFFASSFISDNKWIQIISVENTRAVGVWLRRKGSLGLRWDVLLRKLKKNWSWGEHFQVNTYFMQLFKILSKARQECNLLNMCSGGHSSLQHAKRKILCNRWWKSGLNLRSQITLLLFLTWKFHINYPGSNICVTMCSYLTQHSHTVSFHSNVCGRLAKGENRHHSLYKHMLTNISSCFNFFFFSATLFASFYWSPTPQ